MNILASGRIPKPPYAHPESPVKALSLAMRLEEACRKLNLVGLSAPQVGVSQDLFVYWSNYPEEPRSFSSLMNCRCVGKGDRFLSVESCATFPGDRFGIIRSSSVDVSGDSIDLNEQGEIRIAPEILEFSGPVAAIVQHEFDHVCGVAPDVSGERLFFR